MDSTTIESISLENLLIDLHNPRYDPRSSQREALITIAHDQEYKLVNLAEDIVNKGLNPSDIIMVSPTEDRPNTYVVLEGNRRVAALKLISSIALLESLGLLQRMEKRFKMLHDRMKDKPIKSVYCVVLTREDANYWVQLKHTGENEGIGIVPWNGQARHRFRGNSPALQAIELVENSNYMDENTRKKLPQIAITNIERILGTPDARVLLGVDVKDRQLILRSPEDDALARLTIVVSDIVHGIVKVTQLDTKQQRVNYAQEVASRPLPKSHSKNGTGCPRISPSSTSIPNKQVKRIGVERKTLIPRQLKLNIPHTRINKIYHELQNLDVDKYINACAVMCRVFVEMSVDDYAQRHQISLVAVASSKTQSTEVLPKHWTKCR